MTTQKQDFSHISTVIFDMDGTLIEHTWQLAKICDVLFAKFADDLSPVTQDEFYDCYWNKSHGWNWTQQFKNGHRVFSETSTDPG